MTSGDRVEPRLDDCVRAARYVSQTVDDVDRPNLHAGARQKKGDCHQIVAAIVGVDDDGQGH